MQDIGNREQGQILPCSLIISLLFLIPAGGTSHFGDKTYNCRWRHLSTLTLFLLFLLD